MDFMGFKVRDAEALERLAKDVEEFGCKTERITAGEMPHCGERVRFETPTGHLIELYAEKEFYGNATGIETLKFLWKISRAWVSTALTTACCMATTWTVR